MTEGNVSHQLICLDQRKLFTKLNSKVAPLNDNDNFCIIEGEGISMFPFYRNKDLIVVKKNIPNSEINIEDIVVYELSGKLFCHKVIGKSEKGVITCGTFGKLAKHNVSYDRIVGKAVNFRSPRCVFIQTIFLNFFIFLVELIQRLNIYRFLFKNIVKFLTFKLIIIDNSGKIDFIQADAIEVLPVQKSSFSKLLILACRENMVVGNIELLGESGSWYLKNIFVRLLFRRLGLADRMLSFIIRFCEVNSINKIDVCSCNASCSAKRFLAKNGFSFIKDKSGEIYYWERSLK